MLAGTMLGLLVRDVILSRDEVAGLSANLAGLQLRRATSRPASTCPTGWTKMDAAWVGSTPTKWRGTTGRAGMSASPSHAWTPS